MFRVLIHPTLYRTLRDRPAKDVERFRRRLERLRDGHWGGGTRVKRLKGVRRPLYEARMDAGDRLLFTVVSSADVENPDRLTSHLQVWDLLAHDDVERGARRNRSPDAEFLAMETVEEFAVEAPPPEPAALLDELADTEEPLLSYLLPPEGFVSERLEELQGAQRWFRLGEGVLQDEDQFQRLLDSGSDELELKLTAEQYQVLQRPGPVLLSGSAGSGKTTLAVHRLLQEAWGGDAGGRILYLSYSPWLVTHAERLYEDLVRARGLDPESSEARRRRPSFLTFSKLYGRILGKEERENTDLESDDLVGFEEFREWLAKTGRTISASLVWEELRSILKGACLDLDRSMLDEERYFDLGRKRAPLFVDDREEILPLARSYQSWLRDSGRRDQIDLCRKAFVEVRGGAVAFYDAVICDEVQDLTELELSFLVSLVKGGNLGRVFLAGDTQQILNPSGFRWAEVRRIAHRAVKRGALGKAPETLRLRKNFRSVRPLVTLANGILALRRRLFGARSGEGAEEAVVEGPVPVEVLDGEEAVLEALDGFGPRCAVLVMEEEEAERLRQRLDTSRVFHVADAKGLEFESVVLWKAISSSAARPRFEEVLEPRGRLQKDSGEAALQRALQHLYVAVTRARRHLAIYEGPKGHAFWRSGELEGALEQEEASILPRLFKATASPEEWAEEGELYLERQRFLQAAECFRRAGELQREQLARGLAAEGRRDWRAALEFWQALGDRQRQGKVLERLGRRAEALEVYRQEGLTAEARQCEIRLSEGAGEWRQAAQAWREAGVLREAARCLRRAGEFQEARQVELEDARAAGDGRREGLAWVCLKEYENAEKAFTAADLPGLGALSRGRWQAAAGDFRRASESYREGGNEIRSRRMEAFALEQEGDLAAAAEIWRDLGALSRASLLYRRVGEEDLADQLLLMRLDLEARQVEFVEKLVEEGSLEAALVIAGARLEVLSDLQPELPWLVSAQEEREAVAEAALLRQICQRVQAERAEAAGQWAQAVRFWREAGETERAAAALESSLAHKSSPRAGAILLALGDHERAEKAFERAGASHVATRTAALAAEVAENWQEAARLWSSLDRGRDALRCQAEAARESRDWARAARLFRKAGMNAVAGLIEMPGLGQESRPTEGKRTTP